MHWQVAAQSVVYEQDIKRYYTAESWALKPLAGLLPPQPRLNLQYAVSIKVVAAAQGLYDLSLYVEPQQLSGTHKMDGFDVTPLLWPDSLTLFYSLEQLNGAPINVQTLAEPAAVLREGVHQKINTQPDWSRVRFVAKIIRAKFGANAQALAQARQQMAVFASTTGALGALSADMGHFQTIADPDTLTARQHELAQLAAAVPKVQDLLAQPPFWLSAQDAKTTQVLLNENLNLLEDLKVYLEQQNANRQNLVAAKADRLFQTARRGLALPYYLSVLANDPSNEKATERVALLHLEANQLEQAARLLMKNATLMQGFSHQRTVDKIGRALEVSVLGYMRNDQPDLAKPQVYLLDSLCKAFPGYRCPNLAYTRAAAPVRDHYARLLNKARVETSLDQLEPALASIEAAMRTAQEGGLSEANQQTALTLRAQVAERLIHKTLYQAKNLYEKGQDSLATERLCEAKNWADTYKQVLPALYDKLIKRYTNAFVAKLDGTRFQAQANRYKQALSLTTTPVALPALVLAEPKTNKPQDCKRLQTEVNDWVAKGLKNERNLLFVQAVAAYKRALEAARRKPDCGINQPFLTEKLASIEAPAAYQQLTETAETFLENKQYDSAKSVYTKAASMYEKGNLAAQFLQEQTAYSQARQPRYAGFALFLGQEYVAAQNLDSALAMAQVASVGRFSKDVFKSYINTLAIALARRDNAGNAPNPSFQAQLYTQGDKRLKELEKAYLKAREEGRQ